MARALKVFVGPPNGATTIDLWPYVQRDSIRIEESGTLAVATMEFEVRDRALAYTMLRGQWRVRAEYTIPGTSTQRTLFRGIVRQPTVEARAIFPVGRMRAEAVSSLLDRIVLQRQGLERAAGESDKARLQWLYGNLTGLDGSAIGSPLGITDWSKVKVLDASMPKQKFGGAATLRQATERILAAASPSANYFVDASPRLWTWDDDNPIGDRDNAVATTGRTPYDINAAVSPGSGRRAPSDLQVEWDSDPYRNGYFVVAARHDLNRFYTDRTAALDMAGPYSDALYGDSFGTLQGPDADTVTKVERLVRAALKDTRNPVPRVSFSIEQDDVWNGTATWEPGQLLYVTSTQHGLDATADKAGTGTGAQWAGSSAVGNRLQPFRVVRVTTTLLDGGDNLRKEIEAGGRRQNLFRGE